MSPDRRQRLIPTIILALNSAGMTWSFYTGHLDTQWVAWFGCFLVMELTAVIYRTPGATLSERVWVWIGVRPLRPSRWLRVPTVAVFVPELAVHFVTGGSHWWSGGTAVIATGTPVAVVIVWSLWEQRKERNLPDA